MQEHDVIIIGGGPAGLSCALECKDSNLDHVVLEAAQSTGGQLHEIKYPIPNLASCNPENGSELAAMMEASCRAANLNIKLASRVVSFDFENLTVETETEKYQGKSIFIATGARFRLPAFENLDRLSDYVFYKHGVNSENFENKNVVVVGGGDSALYAALGLEEVARKVHLVHRRKEFKGRRDLVDEVRSSKNIEIITGYRIKALEGDRVLESVVIEPVQSGKTKKLKAERVYAKLGYIPNSELFKDELTMTENGLIVVDQYLRTNKPGIFAGGDVTACEFDRIAIAMGHGSLAASSIRKYLNEDLRKDFSIAGNT